VGKKCPPPASTFKQECERRIRSYENDELLRKSAASFMKEMVRVHYAYNFNWLGRPVIQIPQDLYAMQEIIWEVKPDLIIETGIAHGGSLIMSASMLALIDYCEAVEQGRAIVPRNSKKCVLGIDIEIRPHNHEAIQAHPMAHLIEMIEGSSIDSVVVDKVKARAKNYKKILVCFDSNHTHEHVLAELEAYAPLVSVGSYCIVWDTGIEDFPNEVGSDRPWNKGNNPKTAVWEYLRRLGSKKYIAADGAQLKLEIDKVIEKKLLITAAPDGFLKRVQQTITPAIIDLEDKCL
jgi:cephalosporin hydroxylase